MKIDGKEYNTIWFENNIVKIIDKTKLPHQFIVKDLKTVKDAINAIKIMEVRGAPLIGATAGFVAIFFAIGGAWCITSLVLELPFKIIWDTALVIIMGGLIANLLAGLYFATQALKIKPANFLRAH